MTKLRFVDLHRVAALDYSDAADTKRAWLADQNFSDAERAQLLTNVLQMKLHPELTPEDVFAGDLEFFDRHFDGIAEAALECWQVVDELDKPLYQLWIRGGDGGVLVHVGTTEAVAVECIVQSSWHGDADLGSLLDFAQRELKEARAHPDADVLRISFVS